MDLLGAALPNIMFIVGILAIGLGLGIELKVVSLNKEIDKKGRFGAFVTGLVLIGASVTIYLNPSLTNRGQEAKAEANAAVVAPAATQAAIVVPPTQAPAQAPPTQVPPAPAQALAPAPTKAPAPPQVPTPTPTKAPPPTQVPTPTPTKAPTPTQAPRPAPAPTRAPTVAAPGVLVPNLHGKDDKDARNTLTKAGLKPQKVERCSGTDKGQPKTKKGRVLCQNPPAGQTVAAGTTVEYVLAGK